jgi:GR25 family glycosyltransferase involved in LPS biosynthesis
VEGDDGIFIVEDDVKFARGWKPRLEEIIADLKAKHNDNFVLTAFTSITLCRHNDLPSLHYLPFPNVDKFLGTQGVYYPNAVRKKILTQLEKIDESNRVQYDILIARILKAESIPLYAAIPCLVEHIGYTSSWLRNSHTTAANIFHPVLA